MASAPDIYKAARKKILAKIKSELGSFPKAKKDFTAEQMVKVYNFAERYEVPSSDVFRLVQKNKLAFLAIVAKDPNRMGFYEAELQKYLLTHSKFIKNVELLSKSGKNALYLNNGKISNSKPTGVKSLDLRVTFKNGAVVYVVHKYTHQAGGAQSSALTDVRNTLGHAKGRSSVGNKVYVVAILDGNYYSKIGSKSKISKLEETRLLFPNSVITTWIDFVSDTKHLVNKPIR